MQVSSGTWCPSWANGRSVDVKPGYARNICCSGQSAVRFQSQHRSVRGRRHSLKLTTSKPNKKTEAHGGQRLTVSVRCGIRPLPISGALYGSRHNIRDARCGTAEGLQPTASRSFWQPHQRSGPARVTVVCTEVEVPFQLNVCTFRERPSFRSAGKVEYAEELAAEEAAGSRIRDAPELF